MDKDFTPEYFATMPLTDLHLIQVNLTKGIELKRIAEKKELLELIKKSGFSLEELAGDTKLQKVKKTKEKAAPKFRNPDNHEQTWAGVGPKTQWLKDALAAGRTLDDFLIK